MSPITAHGRQNLGRFSNCSLLVPWASSLRSYLFCLHRQVFCLTLFL